MTSENEFFEMQKWRQALSKRDVIENRVVTFIPVTKERFLMT